MLCLPKAFLLNPSPALNYDTYFTGGKIKDLKCIFDCHKIDTFI